MKAFVAILAVLAGIADSQARIITVDDDGPADFNNIQAAIDDANDGDTVLVADGTYTGAGNRGIEFLGKAISVQSQNGPDACIIDCEYQDRGFSFRLGEDANSVLDGLTINNGDGPDDLVDGHYTSPVGGGIYIWSSSPTIKGCIIGSNLAGLGGGICCCEGSAPTISGCRIVGNAAWEGGGVYSSESSPRIVDCVIGRNLAPTSEIFYGNGAGIYSGDSPTIVSNCTIAYNSATGTGGGIYSYRGYSGYKLTATNCILWDNWAWHEDNEISGRPIVTYSDIDGGYSGTGNINANPYFADSGNDDYHLKSRAGRWDPGCQSWVLDGVTSPCIDAGDPMAPIGQEPFPNGGRVNMGAYGGTGEASKSYFGEPPCETIIAGDINGDCEVNYLDFQILALHWLEDRN